ncbi:MAG: TonB-dependent hemoglobin/transferrin/lactoferrin family receptor [Rhodoferax sp.]|jgi:hemoglobin/transferrin/lactoferrin receptor protein|nr:TonB-dependent hemoglobin/transferrin/lactoferrin family receptor [Rhodoferax sp.]
MSITINILMPKKLTLLVSIALSGSGAALAQSASDPGQGITLNQVVISANRAEQLADDLTLSMDVVNARDIESRQIGDIRDVAKDLPNVSVKRAPARFSVTGRGNPTGSDSNAGFNIRGLGGNRVLMLEDSVRLPRSYNNGVNAFGRDAVDIGLLKRIEIIHGPTSALYGSDGLAGLVNFITLEPLDYLRSDSGSSPRVSGGKAWLSYSGDDHGLAAGGTLARRAGERAEWSLTATTRSADGLSNMGSHDTADVDRTTPNPQSHHARALLGKVVLHPDSTQKHVLTLEHVEKSNAIDLLSSRAKLPYTGTAAQQAALVMAETSSTGSSRSRLTWNARYTLNSALADNLQTVLSWQEFASQQDGQTWRYDRGVRARQVSYDERTWQAHLQAGKTVQMSEQWSQLIRYGLDLTQTDISSLASGSDPAPLASYSPKRFFPDTRDTARAIYVQSELMHDDWSITPGVRFDQFAVDVLSQSGYYPNLSPTPGKSIAGSALSPKLGVLYRLTPQWSVYGNYATGFRAPEGQQVNSALEAFNVKLLPNPDLLPEQSRNFELGIRTRMALLSLDMAIFSGKYSHLIQEKKDFGTADGQAASVTNPTLFQTVNIDQASISGFELRGHVAWGVVAGGQLSTPFSYGMTHGSNDVNGLPLSSIEPAKLLLGLKYQTTAWDVGLTIYHHAEKKASDLESLYIPKSTTQRQFVIPAVTTLDLQGQWRLRKDVRLNFGITNLTDQAYWNWSDVQGLAANPPAPLQPVVDAYTKPGRHLNLALVVDF